MSHRNPNTHRRPFVLARVAALASLALALSLVLAPSALAQDPTSAQYEAGVTQVTSESGGGPGSPSTPASGLRSSVVGGLPFTGLDLIALAAVAAAFTSVGFALRRMTISKHADRVA